VRIVIAPDSFKGTLTAVEAAEAIAEVVRRLHPDAAIDCCPMADGGQGTLDVIVRAAGGQRRRVACRGPLGEPMTAEVGLIDRAATAVVELAAAAGLTLVPPERRNPLHTTTYGVGELLAAALDAQVDRIILALGGSATIDGGGGLAQALGLVVRDAAGRSLPAPLVPARLVDARRIDIDAMTKRFGATAITIAADVLNPLLGPNGAAAVFGPQKGADARAIAALERGLTHWVGLLEGASGRSLRDEPGTGAAGGAALPLLAFTEATIVPGADLVIQAVRLPERLADADLIITGEGRLDGQSLMGKTVGAVARLARSAGVPCVAVAGALGAGHEPAASQLDGVISLTPAGADTIEAMRDARTRLARALERELGKYL
jgi:glycerate kinase